MTNQLDRRSDPPGFFQRKLHRNSDNGPLGGVCAGLAENFNIDPFWIRFAWFLVMWIGGTGFFLYLIAWILLPDVAQPKALETGEAVLPENRDEVPQDLREAWEEVNKITRN